MPCWGNYPANSADAIFSKDVLFPVGKQLSEEARLAVLFGQSARRSWR